MAILKRDSNRLLTTLAREGFDPKLFKLDRGVYMFQEGRFDDRISFKDSRLIFYIATPEVYSRFKCMFSTFSPDYSFTKVFDVTIDSLEQLFVDWLHTHVDTYIADSLEPDLWQRMQLETPLVSGELLTENDYSIFTDEEKRQIKLSINEFKILVIDKFEPSTQQIELLEERLVYLTEAVDRLNRFDWRGVAISAIIAISVALSLDTESGRQLFDLFVKAFSSVVGLIGN